MKRNPIEKALRKLSDRSLLQGDGVLSKSAELISNELTMDLITIFLKWRDEATIADLKKIYASECDNYTLTKQSILFTNPFVWWSSLDEACKNRCVAIVLNYNK